MNTLPSEHAQKAYLRRRYALLISLILHLLILLIALIPSFRNMEAEEDLSAIAIHFVAQELFENETTDSENIAVSSPKPSENNSGRPVVSRAGSPPNPGKTLFVSRQEEVVAVATGQEKMAELKNSQAKENLTENDGRHATYREKKNRYSALLSDAQKSGPRSVDEADDPSRAVEQQFGSESSSGTSGFGKRKAVFIPEVKDGSQKTGKINIAVCVDAHGNVTQANYTQQGSSSNDAYLIRLSKRYALLYKFEKADVEKQCGNILFDYVLNSLAE